MRSTYALAMAFVIGFVVGAVLIATSGGRAEYRAIAEQAQRELDRGLREVEESRKSVAELTLRNTELEDALTRAEIRNSRITEALERAERDVTDAVETAGDLSRLITEIVGIVDSIFEAGSYATAID